MDTHAIRREGELRLQLRAKLGRTKLPVRCPAGRQSSQGSQQVLGREQDIWVWTPGAFGVPLPVPSLAGLSCESGVREVDPTQALCLGKPGGHPL